jgi:hypothetical protein
MDIVEALPTLHPTVARVTLYRLRASLPPFPDATPEETEEFVQEAVAAIAALYPNDAYEARLAVRFVAADCQATECLRLANQPDLDPATARRCRAQATSMMRESKGALLILRRDQATREKALAAREPRAMERAGYWFMASEDMMPPAPDAAPTPPPALVEPPAPAEPRPRTYEEMDEAERYGAVYPRRAALIRHHGGVPPNCDFIPPEPDLVRAIVASTSPILRALDELQPAAAD